MNTDVLIIGAGPAGIFTAMEAAAQGEQGEDPAGGEGQGHRGAPLPQSHHRPLHELQALLPHHHRVLRGGGLLRREAVPLHRGGRRFAQLIGEEQAESLIQYADSIYLEFGADARVEGVGEKEAIKEIRKRAIQTGLKLVDCPIRHLGTEKAQEIYGAIEGYLLEHGVEIRFGCACNDLLLKDGACLGARLTQGQTEFEVYAKETVVAAGRRGADWFDKLCARHGIAHAPGPGGHRRAGGGAQRGDGDGEQRPLRVQAHRLPQAL